MSFFAPLVKVGCFSLQYSVFMLQYFIFYFFFLNYKKLYVSFWEDMLLLRGKCNSELFKAFSLGRIWVVLKRTESSCFGGRSAMVWCSCVGSFEGWHIVWPRCTAWTMFLLPLENLQPTCGMRVLVSEPCLPQHLSPLLPL